ncbi:hypothetical protein SAMN05216483_1896 [Streptomyces sp. 2131.1]|uniref:hypothetical protein n=1 Tax=Streptomyces sp. 2131.1 TaxID=1855346 RepID=UPI00089AB485|nr:hypothetical protein [Streptomyces sp. 2131.1]SEC53777.1 hypothetical protein SAMN05216483_1896 [Streptomyces sp. 2131.1]
MSTFETTARFDRDFKKLLPEERARFQDCVRKKFVPDAATGRFRPGLRVKPVQGVPLPAGARPVMEMTWAPDGRATWQYADEVHAGEPHIVWRRVGGHEIFDPGPA